MKKWYEKYVKDLANRVEVNVKALKVSEKGVDMEVKKYPGFHIPEIRTYGDDVIIDIQTLGNEPSSEVISFIRIDSNGLNMVTAEDSMFEEKMVNMLGDLGSKRVFLFNKNFILQHLEVYMIGIPPDITDFDEMLQVLYTDPKVRGVIFSIPPWDPIGLNSVTETWRNGDTDLVKAHAIASALRLYYLYLDYIVMDSINVPLTGANRVITGSTFINVGQGGRVKLPAP